MITSPLYNQEGKEIGQIKLPENIFGVKWNADLVHQAVTSAEANKRTSIAHAKDRAQVRGGGKKPWKQKGTGRARHGSIRSPLWRHGGKAHGPTKDKDYSKKLNKKMRTKALSIVLSAKLRDGEIMFLDKLSLSEMKTKLALSVLSKLGKKEFLYKKGKRALIALSSRDTKVEKSFRNIPVAEVVEGRNMNAALALTYKYIIFVDYKHDN